MQGLTAALLARACQVFLTRAYAGDPPAIPAAKRMYLNLAPEQPLEPLLKPPVCQTLHAADGSVRGYAFRLGSTHYPHLKLQVVDSDRRGTLVFAVDTHDALHLDPQHPDAAGWAEVREANRRLKEAIEHAWEAEGLLTFNGLLRRQLQGGAT